MMPENQGFWILLVIVGCVLILVGCLGYFSDKIPFAKYWGHMPGDFRAEKEGFRFYFPLATCLILSGLISVIVWIFRKFM